MTTLPTPPPERERRYPLAAPTDDERFSFGLMLDVAQVLLDHGYPRVSSGDDMVALQQALFGFLYVPVSEHLGNDVTGLGFSREPDEVKPTSAVPAHVDGHSEFSGRASVPPAVSPFGHTAVHVPLRFEVPDARPDTSCLAVLPSGARCDEPIYWNAPANAWWHERQGLRSHTATGPSVPPSDGGE